MGIETAAYIIGAAAAVGGTALSYQAAQDQKSNANDAAARQQQQSQLDAQYAAGEAELQARAIRKASDKQRAEARAALSQSGVVVGEGTAEQIDQTIQENAEQDALMAIYDGGNRARQIRAGGEVQAWQSRNAGRAAGMQATGALIGGASALSSAYTGWSRNQRK